MAVLSVNRALSVAKNAVPHVYKTTKSYLGFSNSFSLNAPCLQKLVNQTKTAKRKDSSADDKGVTVTADSLFDADRLLRFPLFNPERVPIKLRESVETIVSPSTAPSVTRILNATMPESSKIALNAWKARMIKEMGKEGFDRYQQNLLARGRKLHQQIHNHLSHQSNDLDITEEIEKFWSSLSQVFPEIEKAIMLEKNVIHPLLGYHGIVDCVALFRGHLVVIDWKTSEKPKPTLQSIYDNPIQAVAYLGALNFDPAFQHHIDQVAIIIAYEDGAPAQIHHLPQKVCQQYWNSWLARLKTYWTTFTDKLKPIDK